MLAKLTSIYHFAFAASQIPVGAAMDRFGVRPVSLSLLAGTIVGALASGLARGPESFLFGQFLLGVATSGMLMCPMTLAAKQMSAARFGLWSGIILSIGNIGMLLSSSPLAFVVEHWGMARRLLDLRRLRRGGGGCGVPAGPETIGRACRRVSPLSQMAEVLRIGLSRPLRGLIALSLVSLAASLVLRGLWGGPWLMEIKAPQPHPGGQCAWPVHACLDRRTRADGNSRSQHRSSPRSAGRHAFICRVCCWL